MSGAPIRSIAVVGNGTATWLAAAVLATRLPGVALTVIADPAAPLAPLDLYAGLRPDLAQLLSCLSVSEPVFLLEAGAAYRVGQRVEDWIAPNATWFDGFATTGQRIDGAAFHHAWLHACRTAHPAPFAAHNPTAAMAETNRFSIHQRAGDWPWGAVDHGYAADPEALRKCLRQRAERAGVRVIRTDVRGADVIGERITSLRLGTGQTISADLFVDATGTDAALLSLLPGGAARDDWRQWLPVDRLIAARTAPPADPPLFDRITATAVGWRMSTALPGSTFSLYGYAASAASDAKAQRTLRNASGAETFLGPVSLPQGRRQQPWIGNCVAIGDAALVIEPLGGWSLGLLGLQIELLVSQLPGDDFARVELAEYQRKFIAGADAVRDLLIAHYQLSRRVDLVWRDARQASPPAELQHRMDLFRACGRLPPHDGDVVPSEAWITLLIAAGIVPDRLDPAAELIPAARFDRISQIMQQRIAAMIGEMPSHRTFLDATLRPAASGDGSAHN